MMTYNKADTLFQSAKNKAKGKPIGRNTRLRQVSLDSFGIQYHSTIILLINRDGSYEYHNGGWDTITTKQRMNEYGPLSIFSIKGEWFARYKGETIPYFNGVSTTEWEVKVKNEFTFLDRIQENFKE